MERAIRKGLLGYAEHKDGGAAWDEEDERYIALATQLLAELEL